MSRRPAGTAASRPPAPRSSASAADDPRRRQKQRTRQALLQAAADLLANNGRPSLEEVAAHAGISRATAYRYFPSVDALYLEAAVDLDSPDPQRVLAGTSVTNATSRLERIDDALEAMTLANQASLRMMMAHWMEHSARGGNDPSLPARQNRRTPLIDAALAPMADRFTPATAKRLKQALALVVGLEAYIVCKDVLRLDDAEARKVRRWAIRALVAAAEKSAT